MKNNMTLGLIRTEQPPGCYEIFNTFIHFTQIYGAKPGIMAE